MTRENVLFIVVGLLAGYVAAFHLVVYMNQQPAAGVGGRAPVTAEAGALPSNEVKERQRLLSAAEAAGQAAREDADNFDTQMRAAQAYFEAGEFEEAIDFLTRANQLRPEDYDTLVKLGLSNYAARRFDTAEKWYLAALAKRPDDENVRTALAETYYDREPRQLEKAMAVLREALEHDPDHVTSLHNLSFLLIEAKKFDEAAATLDRLERADPSYPQLPGLRDELRKARGSAPADSMKSPAD